MPQLLLVGCTSDNVRKYYLHMSPQLECFVWIAWWNLSSLFAMGFRDCMVEVVLAFCRLTTCVSLQLSPLSCSKLLKACCPRIPKGKKLLWAGDCLFVSVFDDVLDVDAFNTFVCVICLMLTHVVV